MSTKTSIEWTDATWNPVTGCTKISPGCKHCYAERMAFRLQAMGSPNYSRGFEVTLQTRALELPLKWKKPLHIFVNSMSDLFHPVIPDDYIARVFDVMNRAHWHRFQILTKRPDKLLKLDGGLPWAAHIWMGVSVENEKYQFRIDELRQSRATVKFLSLEPLLGSLQNLDLSGIDWVIVGGESGPGSRPMKESWVIEIRDQCLSQDVAFFFKQWGGVRKSKNGRLLQGCTWDQMPALGVLSRVSS